MTRVFVARDGDNKPQGWVYASLDVGNAWISSHDIINLYPVQICR